MALLSLDNRKKYFKYLGYGEYNKTNIRKFQKKYFSAKYVDGAYGANTDTLLRHVYNVKANTKNFEPEEFKCTCGKCTGYPSYMKKVELDNLQAIRDHYGKPMTITSGLRCKWNNEHNCTGSIQNSKHLTGYAADFNIEGVTESLAQRKAAIKWIKKLPNHNYTYGHGYNSNGVSISAVYMGTGKGAALHTDTNQPKKVATKTDKILAACKTQANWMKNYKYGWEMNPTIAKSKKKGTCVTYVACVLQRIGVLKSGQYIWHNNKGKVTHANNKMSVSYPSGTLKSLKGKLKAGDIVMAGIALDVGSGSHIFVLTGKWDSKGNPYIWDNHSAEYVKKGKAGAHTYSGTKNVIAIVRIK